MISFIFIRVIILLIISIQCDASNYTCDKNIVPCGCGQITAEINARIVDGENSIPHSWSMMVSLRNDRSLSSHMCGGTILSESYILTAAHCVDMFSDSFLFGNLTIVAGIHSLSQSDGIIRQVDKIIIHHLWKEFHSDIQYDIAILHLAEPLNLTRSSPLTRTCLPPRLNTLEEMMQYPSNGTRLVVIGWGALETTGSSPPDILQQVTMYSMHHFDSICATSLRDPSVQFCAGLYEGGKSACYGDSGGPIFQWIGDRWEQVGIVSYGEMGCGPKGYPTVFTRISYFYDWIQSHMNNNNSTNISDNTTTNDRTLYECFSQCGCGRRNVALSSSTIVKSENALPHSWSMIVSIRGGTTHQHICSGTILEDFYVLTSAHCIANRSLQDITIEAGMYYQSESNAIIRQVNRISIHPNYTMHSNSLMNDIAILQVTLPFYIEDDRFVSRICLPPEFDDEIDLSKYPSNITPLAVVGWDIRNMSTSSTPKILQQAKVYVMDSENSNCSLSADQRSRQFCAGHRYENDTEMCNGDDGFGDPIFQWTSRNWVQVGLGSYCGMSDKRAIFTNLAAYSGWIKSIVNATIKTSSNIYQCDKKAPCGCGRIDVNLTISGMVGAETAKEYSWPMIVSLQYDGRHRCGGTILSDSFILTSARCIAFNRYIDDSYAPNMTILVGVNGLLGNVTIRRQIDKTFIHPNFLSPHPDLHDIAIVHLGQPLPLDDLSSTLARTCLPAMSESLTDDYLKPNSPLVAIGWDRYIYEDEISQSLQQLSVRTLDHEHALCSNFINNNTYQFCAEPASSSGSRYVGYLCEGGSGGPVLMYKNNRWEQVGITPYTVECNYAGRLRVYTRVSPYVEWMKNIMNSSTPTTQPPTTTTQPSTATNQRRNTFIFEILFILIIMFL